MLDSKGTDNRYKDSEPMEFDGDIIITDPCYIVKDGDWLKCRFGEHMDWLGLQHYMVRCTIYGDWSCTCYNSETEEEIGEFTADAGMVGVFLLDEVLKYNPAFDYHIERPWTTTLIKNFKGTVQFKVNCIEGVYEETTEYHEKGEAWEEYEVTVIGHGANKSTGGSINFVTKQTGL